MARMRNGIHTVPTDDDPESEYHQCHQCGADTKVRSIHSTGALCQTCLRIDFVFHNVEYVGKILVQSLGAALVAAVGQYLINKKPGKSK